MKNKIFYLVLLMIFVCHIDAKLLQKEFIPGITDATRLQLTYIKNDTNDLEFQVFPPGDFSIGLVLPGTTFHVPENSKGGIDIIEQSPVVIKCCKGSFFPVFIKDSGATSGEVQEGYDGPFYVSMWMQYPQVSESAKIQLPYVVTSGKTGKVGLIIGEDGTYRLIADEDVLFL